MNKQTIVMDAEWVPDEALVRNHRALSYSTRVELRRLRREKKVDRMVQRLFTLSVVLWMVTVMLTIWSDWLL